MSTAFLKAPNLLTCPYSMERSVLTISKSGDVTTTVMVAGSTAINPWIFGFGSLMFDRWETAYGCTDRKWADLPGFNGRSTRNLSRVVGHTRRRG